MLLLAFFPQTFVTIASCYYEAVLTKLKRCLRRSLFPGSSRYWERRYAAGGTSGAGSAGRLAEYKANFINSFVKEQEIRSVIEFGCGDGQQLARAEYPSYVGIDVSQTAVERCKSLFKTDETKRFLHSEEYRGEKADLGLSLDVIYHLTEDQVFGPYMRQLFGAATKFVVIYSSDNDRPSDVPHIKHRKFSDWVRANLPTWNLIRNERNPFPGYDDAQKTFAEFYVFSRLN
jgi:SAM-dependent methyltransferase